MNEPDLIALLGFCECGCGELAPLSTRNDPRRGYVKGQPHRFIAGHHKRPAKPQYVEQDHGHSTPCWVWQWSRNPHGYGVLNREGRPQLVHRMWWVQRNGEVPDGLELDHLCGMRACVNPDHLEPVTHAENMRRGAGAKLTAVAVRAIRASNEDALVLAARFGVARRTIYSARSGEHWKDVT